MNFNATVFGLALGAMTIVGSAYADEALEFSSALTDGKVYALAALLAQTGRSELDFTAAEADFNDDGRLDVLAFAQVSDFCGSGGCSPSLFIGTKKGWKEVPFQALEVPQNWYLLDSSRNGYRMIAVLGDDSEQSYAWNGEAYVAVDN